MRVFHSRSVYREPAWADSLHDERLVVHRRTKRARNKHLVIFVHGLGGTRYGASSMWGDLPAYFALLPITREVYTDILAGKLKAASIPPVGIQQDTLATNFIYVGAVLGIDLIARGAAMDGLKQQLNFLARRRPLKLLTRPVTNVGLKLAHNFGFQPTDGRAAGIGHLYAGELEFPN